MAINITELWDFSKPAVSEERFREALATATPEDQFILRTQIARSWGIRKDFAAAGAVLGEIEPDLDSVSPEGRLRYWLELGRTYCSPVHPADTQTDETKATARDCYLKAFEIGKEAHLDYLAVDALHMMTMVETDGADQVKWNQQALAYMENSDQAEAKQWEGSLRNNLGYALHQLGRYDEALHEFKLALDLRERAGKPVPIRIAHWMIAWTLGSMGRTDEALSIQLRLEKEWDEAGEPDPYVYEELEKLYRAVNDNERADHYADKLENA